MSLKHQPLGQVLSSPFPGLPSLLAPALSFHLPVSTARRAQVPADALRCALRDFLGLDQLKYLLTTPCARPRAGTANTDRAPVALIPGSSQAPAPAEAAPRHREHSQGLRLQAHHVTRSKGRSPRSGPAPRHLHSAPRSPPTHPTLAAHAHQHVDCSSAALCTGYAALVKKSLRLNPLRGHTHRLWSWP